MGYHNSFVTLPTGERLFLREGSWTRPFIIPDTATEQRLLEKEHWLILITCLLIASLLIIKPNGPLFDPLFWAWMFIIYVAHSILRFIVLQPDLRKLKRGQSRITLKIIAGERAYAYSIQALVLKILGSLAIVGVGLSMISAGKHLTDAAVLIAIFTWNGVNMGYSLYLKQLVK